MLTPARRRRLFVVMALLAASTLFITSIEAQIVHHHRSPESAATCPICHLLHRTAVRGATGQTVSNLQPHCLKKLLPHSSLRRANPLYTPSSPRAPPAA